VISGAIGQFNIEPLPRPRVDRADLGVQSLPAAAACNPPGWRGKIHTVLRINFSHFQRNPQQVVPNVVGPARFVRHWSIATLKNPFGGNFRNRISKRPAAQGS